MPDAPASQEVFIRGITREGRTFRPSDWAERLAGVMAQFRPGGAAGGTPGCVVRELRRSWELRSSDKRLSFFYIYISGIIYFYI